MVLNVDKRVQSGIVKFVCRFNASDSVRTSTVYNFNVKVYDLVGNESSSPYSLKVNALCDYQPQHYLF